VTNTNVPTQEQVIEVIAAAEVLKLTFMGMVAAPGIRDEPLFAAYAMFSTGVHFASLNPTLAERLARSADFAITGNLEPKADQWVKLVDTAQKLTTQVEDRLRSATNEAAPA
jgi:hypothetical protein